MFFFTADEHYGHLNIIKHCKRPFTSVEAMDKALIANHNNRVRKGDTVIHGGDFSWLKSYKEVKEKYISKLNGNHIFIRGNHDSWLNDPECAINAHEIVTEKIDGQLIVVCHYAMRVWQGSHQNSWQLYGHSHNRLQPAGKQCDIGVDAYCFPPFPRFSPFSFSEVREIMEISEDNFDLIKR